MGEIKKASTELVSDKPLLHVLLADDSQDNRVLIQAYLENTAYHLDAAENGKIAVDKFRSGKYALVLMDMQMPVMDGYAATKAIREWETQMGFNPTPIIALTAHVFKAYVQRSLDAGCTDYVTKPVSRQVLMETIHKYAKGVSSTKRIKAGKVRFRVPEEIKDLVPAFLANRVKDLRILREKLEVGDFQTIQEVGHDMRGSGGSYGFDAVTQIGQSLEEAAKDKDSQRVQKLVNRLASVLESVEVVYE